MSLLPINLDFDGYYWADSNQIPEKPGIYCIYSTKQQSKEQQSQQCQQSQQGQKEIDKLLYIGQAGSGDFSTLRSRIRNHAVMDYKEGKYAYSFTMLPAKHLDIVEAALVFQFNPQGNNKNLTKVYEGPDLEVTIKGKCFGMQDFRLFYGTERF